MDDVLSDRDFLLNILGRDFLADWMLITPEVGVGVGLLVGGRTVTCGLDP